MINGCIILNKCYKQKIKTLKEGLKDGFNLFDTQIKKCKKTILEAEKILKKYEKANRKKKRPKTSFETIA